MKPQGRWVFETNTLVSHLLLVGSVPNRAVGLALQTGQLLVSDETLGELEEVLARPKFNKYLSVAERRRFFELLGRVAVYIPVIRTVQACRDTRDDKFLSVAVIGGADAIISGDKDLLSLNPFLGIPILTPAEFLQSDFNPQTEK